jgi:hypothetical protein
VVLALLVVAEHVGARTTRDLPAREHSQEPLDVVVAAGPLEVSGRELANEVALAVKRGEREA